MKKKFFFFLTALCVMMRVSAKDAEQKVFLSPDKSKLYISQKDYIDVDNQAGRFINDSLSLATLVEYGKLDLASACDSIIPSWTHVFGMEVHLRRQFVIRNKIVRLDYPEYYFTLPINEGSKRLFIIFSLLLLVVSFAIRLGGLSVLMIRRILLFFLLLVFPTFLLLGFIRSEYFTYFDCIILTIILVLPSFVCSFIGIEKIRMLSRSLSLFLFKKIKLSG